MVRTLYPTQLTNANIATQSPSHPDTQVSDTIHNSLADNKVGEWILNTIQNPPLLATAYVLPTLLNALAGFLTTIISLYTAYDSDWSIIVLLTVITSGLSVAYSLILLYIYKFGKLERLK
ncbi:uncharacterized protein N7525_011125 [Penicillium rubens]|uniref:uncharacterized protein n=1 Tax=Penicillium rubens TaxID=1108849 RepID=UPI002A59AF30|nr:uncharacterized protein N7525_011125 [Penicillium rubens]KAJ5821841.1 hypothetical protein N7525_011125 [Penicillium rubens]